MEILGVKINKLKILLYVLIFTIISCNNNKNNDNKNQIKKSEFEVKVNKPIVNDLKIKKNEVKIDSIDHKQTKKLDSSIRIEMSSGFSDKFYLFKFYLKEKKIEEITCKFDESLGICLTSEDRTIIGGKFSILKNKFKEGDTLKMIVDNDTISIKLTKKHDCISISKNDKYWYVTYIRGIVDNNEIYYLE